MPECIVLVKKYSHSGRQAGIQYEATLIWKEEGLRIALDGHSDVNLSELPPDAIQKSSTTHAEPVTIPIGRSLVDLLFRLDIVLKAHRILYECPWTFIVNHIHPSPTKADRTDRVEILSLEDDEYKKVCDTVAKASTADLRD